MLGTVPVRTLLEREVTVAAARLAAFLAASLPRAEGVLADGVAFLEAMARPADCNGRPAEWRVARPADALWPVLCGIDTWPAALRPYAGPVPADGLGEWLDSPPAARATAAVMRNAACTVLLTAEHDDTAFHRGLALVREAGAAPRG